MNNAARREALSLAIENRKNNDSVPVEHPSVIKMAQNLARSVKEAVVHAFEEGDVQVDEDEFLDRLESCVECDLFEASEVRCSHESCGCYLKVKAHLASATCPLFMWPYDLEKSDLAD